jgi:hypothetical protein
MVGKPEDPFAFKWLHCNLTRYGRGRYFSSQPVISDIIPYLSGLSERFTSIHDAGGTWVLR